MLKFLFFGHSAYVLMLLAALLIDGFYIEDDWLGIMKVALAIISGQLLLSSLALYGLYFKRQWSMSYALVLILIYFFLTVVPAFFWYVDI